MELKTRFQMSNQLGNTQRKEDFNQVCVWPGTIVGDDNIDNFTEWAKDIHGVRVQYLEEITTNPDADEYGNSVIGTGGRTDVFFAVHKDDVMKFAIPQLALGIRWIEAVLDPLNYRSNIYPERVFGYMSNSIGAKHDD